VGWVRATFGYGLLACLVTWPLPLYLNTRVLGDTGSDLGVYLWNVWIFSHELLEHGHLPFSTDHVFAFTGGVDFAFHNYTPVVGLLGVPLLGWLGVVATFNTLLLASIAASGMAVFGLARRIGASSVAAWVAGALFAASPVLVARQTAHTSLVLAAPLPLFLWALLRTLDTGRTRDGVAVGAAVAFATYADPYYGVYCVLMGLVCVAARFIRLERWNTSSARVGLARVIDAMLAVDAVVIAWRLLSGATSLALGPLRVSIQTLYTPMLVLVLLTTLRLWLRTPVVIRLRARTPGLRRLVPAGAAAVAIAAMLLLPLLVGVASRAAGGRLPDAPTYWRSSPRGLDVLAFVVPNPNLRWLGGWNERAFMPAAGDAFPEFVGSFSIVGLALVAAAAWRRKLPVAWTAFTLFFTALALGPFVHVAGINTQAVGPWALMRYVPLIGLARSPSRFAVVATLGLCVLVAFALDAYLRGRPTRWRASLVAAGLALELLPLPRVLFSAEVPEAYERLAADTARAGRVLELPTGIRDGMSSLGNFRASTMYFQTVHGRPLLGGYVSRVSEGPRHTNRSDRVLRVLHALSGGTTDIPSSVLDEALRGRRAFLARTCLAFVVVDLQRATPMLRDFSRRALRLERLYGDAEYEVLAPVDPPPCTAASPPEHRRPGAIRPRKARSAHTLPDP
jgi:hypothetical protein